MLIHMRMLSREEPFSAGMWQLICSLMKRGNVLQISHMLVPEAEEHDGLCIDMSQAMILKEEDKQDAAHCEYSLLLSSDELSSVVSLKLPR